MPPSPVPDLVVKGTCHGGTFIDKDLAIRGVRTRKSGKPILDGGIESLRGRPSPDRSSPGSR